MYFSIPASVQVLIPLMVVFDVAIIVDFDVDKNVPAKLCCITISGSATPALLSEMVEPK